MRTAILSLLMAILISSTCSAVLIGAFLGTHELVERSPDIVIARCVSIPKGAPLAFPDGVYTGEIEVVKVLKGKLTPGHVQLQTVFVMEPGKTYLLCASPRGVPTPPLGAFWELSVVQVPESFSLSKLDGMPIEEKVRTLFAARRTEVIAELELRQKEHPDADLGSLREEKRLLDQAIGEQKPVGSRAAPAKVDRLSATLGTNQPLYVGKEIDRMMLFFAVVNDGAQRIDPRIGASQIVVNGKALPDSQFILSNGPRSACSPELRPGACERFGYALGDRFGRPGTYRVYWQGAAFRSPEVIFRVLPTSSAPISKQER